LKRSIFPSRGVSLIEAVVALGVMAFGMLAVVGLQATLRGNGDLSRQRSEAVRIAQAAVEEWRAVRAIEATAGVLDFAELATEAALSVPGTNATYSRTRSVPPQALQSVPGVKTPFKTLVTTVTWDDRSGLTQSVRMVTSIAAVAPELAGSLAIPPHGIPSRTVRGRNSTIPVLAKDLGDGRSVFKPPQPGGGTVAWVFNNTTGLITSLCTVALADTTDSLVLGDLTTCTNVTAQLLSGYVRFAATGVQPTPAESETPTGTSLNLDVILTLTSAGHNLPGAVCYDDATDDAATASTREVVTYYCSIISNAAFTWAGRARISPQAFTDTSTWTIAGAAGAGVRTVCRYTPVATDASSKNSNHPLNYTEAGSKPKASLNNQNFLVISAAHTCPTDTPAAGDFVNSNTLLHQDGTGTYDNP
jgi:Tfp pilus assembly protein PilV